LRCDSGRAARYERTTLRKREVELHGAISRNADLSALEAEAVAQVNGLPGKLPVSLLVTM